MENQRKCNGCNEIKSIRSFGYCGDCCNAFARKKYQENREKRLTRMKEHNSQYIECECGCVIQCGSLSEHKQSNKHKKLIESKQKIDENTKICSVCKEVKNKTEFCKCTNTKDMLSYRCKTCDKERQVKKS